MTSTSPQILLLQLGDGMQREIAEDGATNTIIRSIKAKYRTITETSASNALKQLRRPNLRVVVAIDGGIAHKNHCNFQGRLAQYAKDGGTVIFGCLFSSFCRPPDAAEMFRKFGLNWETGDYHRTTFGLSPGAHSVFSDSTYATLLPTYSMKALHLKGVQSSAKIYTPSEDSLTESRVFAPTKVDTQQSPAVFAEYEEGFVGYIGDVNNELGSQALIMAMLESVIDPSDDEPDEIPALVGTEIGCVVCGSEDKPKKCQGCMAMQYCSTLCQKADWPSHKGNCGKARA